VTSFPLRGRAGARSSQPPDSPESFNADCYSAAEKFSPRSQNIFSRSVHAGFFVQEANRPGGVVS